MSQHYRDDLAYIHDVGHGEFARRAAPYVLRLLREHKIESGLVVDLGCGSGILAESISTAGYDVLGIDISPAMIALAKKRAPGAEFRCESFLRSKLPPCAAVTSISECFNYLFDGTRRGNAALTQLFRRIHGALVPGGLFVFDVLTTEAMQRSDPPRRFREGNDWAVLVEVVADEARLRLTRKITSFRKIDELYRRDYEEHCVQLFDAAALVDQLRSIGFRATRKRHDGEMQLGKGQVAIVAQKAR